MQEWRPREAQSKAAEAQGAGKIDFAKRTHRGGVSGLVQGLS